MSRVFVGLTLTLLLPNVPTSVIGLRLGDQYVRGELVWPEWASPHWNPETNRDFDDMDYVREFDDVNSAYDMETYNKQDCEMLKNLWQTAQRSLTSAQTTSARCSQIELFNLPSCREVQASTNTYCTRGLSINGVTLYFDKIWKNANSAIDCNLRILQETDAASCNKDWSHNSSTLRFTLVRDPLSRFVSGYSEIEYRIGKRRQFQKNSFVSEAYPFEEYNVGSRERAMQFIQHVLTGNIDGHVYYLNVFNHVHPQVGTIKQGGALVVGKLEEFDIAWARIEKYTGCRMPFNFGCGTHPETNSDSENPSRTAMAALLQEPGVAESIKCSLLLPDYACFDNAGLNIQMPQCVPHFVATKEEFATITERMKQLYCPDGIKLFPE